MFAVWEVSASADPFHNPIPKLCGKFSLSGVTRTVQPVASGARCKVQGGPPCWTQPGHRGLPARAGEYAARSSRRSPDTGTTKPAGPGPSSGCRPHQSVSATSPVGIQQSQRAQNFEAIRTSTCRLRPAACSMLPGLGCQDELPAPRAARLPAGVLQPRVHSSRRSSQDRSVGRSEGSGGRPINHGHQAVPPIQPVEPGRARVGCQRLERRAPRSPTRLLVLARQAAPPSLLVAQRAVRLYRG